MKSSETFSGNRGFSIISPGVLCIANASLPSFEFLTAQAFGSISRVVVPNYTLREPQVKLFKMIM